MGASMLPCSRNWLLDSGMRSDQTLWRVSPGAGSTPITCPTPHLRATIKSLFRYDW